MSDTTEWLHFHFSLSCVGEGNGNLLQCSCLENPRDGGAWWAAVSGVAQSQTQLKRLGSSSSVISFSFLFANCYKFHPRFLLSLVVLRIPKLSCFRSIIPLSPGILWAEAGPFCWPSHIYRVLHILCLSQIRSDQSLSRVQLFATP